MKRYGGAIPLYLSKWYLGQCYGTLWEMYEAHEGTVLGTYKLCESKVGDFDINLFKLPQKGTHLAATNRTYLGHCLATPQGDILRIWDLWYKVPSKAVSILVFRYPSGRYLDWHYVTCWGTYKKGTPLAAAHSRWSQQDRCLGTPQGGTLTVIMVPLGGPIQGIIGDYMGLNLLSKGTPLATVYTSCSVPHCAWSNIDPQVWEFLSDTAFVPDLDGDLPMRPGVSLTISTPVPSIEGNMHLDGPTIPVRSDISMWAGDPLVQAAIVSRGFKTPVKTNDIQSYLPTPSLSMVSSSSGAQNERVWLLGEAYARTRKAYLASQPSECAVVKGLDYELSDDHMLLFSGAIKWDSEFKPYVPTLVMYLGTRLWPIDIFCKRLAVEWVIEFVNKAIYGSKYVNLSRWPKSTELWRFSRDTYVQGSGQTSSVAQFLCEDEFNRSATINIMLGGVSYCQLVSSVLVDTNKDRKEGPAPVMKYIHQICINPLTGEFDLFCKSVASIFRMEYVDISTFHGAVVIGTKSVRKRDDHEIKPFTSTQGIFASRKNRSPTKSVKGDVNKRNNFSLFVTNEVMIYDGRSLVIDWDDLNALPRFYSEIPVDSVVAVGHTVSYYASTKLSLHVQFTVLLT
ncbi:hypothetical protein M422DRAFT_45677 [Sphaerobolus stellatus SS14]|nr:hypothetical protein M422DRAFT_45677 [Sphaerobolus stellatus SS14]